MSGADVCESPSSGLATGSLSCSTAYKGSTSSLLTLSEAQQVCHRRPGQRSASRCAGSASADAQRGPVRARSRARPPPPSAASRRRARALPRPPRRPRSARRARAPPPSGALNVWTTTRAASNAGAISAITAWTRSGQVSSAEQHRTGGADHRAGDDQRRDRDPDLAHRAGRRRPSRAQAEAAITGIPAGVNGNQRQRHDAAQPGDERRRAGSQLALDQQAEEEGREDRIEAERLRIPDQVAGEDPERRPDHPEHGSREPSRRP